MTVVIKGLRKWEVIGLKATYRENVTVLPSQHGRLIDGDAAEVITADHEDGDFIDGILYAADWIANQPTVIEAEEEKT